MPTNVDFLIPLAAKLIKYTDAPSAAQSYLSSLLDRTIEALSTHFDLSIYLAYMRAADIRGRFTTNFPWDDWPGPMSTARDTSSLCSIDSIGLVLEYSYRHGTGQCATILDRARDQAPKLGSNEITESFFPFLSDLLPVVETSSREAQLCVQALLDVYAKQFVGYEPEEPKDWRRPEQMRECREGCALCSQINKFLEDYVETWELPSSKWEWSHPWKFANLRQEWREQDNTKMVFVKKSWKEEHCRWETCLGDAVKTIGQLPKDKLRECLGSRWDEYQDLRFLRGKQDPTETSTEEVGESRSQKSSTVPRKRHRSSSGGAE